MDQTKGLADTDWFEGSWAVEIYQKDYPIAIWMAN